MMDETQRKDYMLHRTVDQRSNAHIATEIR